MTENNPPRLYISAMETDVVGLPRFDPLADELLARLSAIGYSVAWEKQFRGYEVIERDIAASDALLAIVDETWSCSTWMSSEVTWATGDFGAIETSNPPMMPIPILLYPVVSDATLRFPFNYRLPIILDRAVEKAVVRILEVLPLSSMGQYC